METETAEVLAQALFLVTRLGEKCVRWDSWKLYAQNIYLAGQLTDELAKRIDETVMGVDIICGISASGLPFLLDLCRRLCKQAIAVDVAGARIKGEDIEVAGKTVYLVDASIISGETLEGACRLLEKRRNARVIGLGVWVLNDLNPNLDTDTKRQFLIGSKIAYLYTTRDLIKYREDLRKELGLC